MTLNNKPKISVFIATSIDGYIAKKNNDIDWLTKFDPPTGEGEMSVDEAEKFADFLKHQR